LQKRQLSTHALVGLISDGVEQDEGDVLADDGCSKKARVSGS
jgi:hypothetical protein